MANDQKPAGIQPFDEFLKEIEAAQHADLLRLPQTKVTSADAFETQRRHLLDRYGGVSVEHSFTDAGGQIFDCIPAEQQPALKSNDRKLARPPELPRAEVPASGAQSPGPIAGRADRFGNSTNCPPGTVAVRRLTLAELARFETLDHFKRKAPRHRRRSLSVAKPADAADPEPPHRWAHASLDVPNLGGHSLINIWAPEVQSPQIFSLSQHWYVAGAGAGTQTAEVGWQVYPGKYNHSKPVLFTYWTADDYQTTGAYNDDDKDFVLSPGAQYSPGMALDPASQTGGPQVELEVSYYLSGGNWWLFVNGTGQANAVGYYPASQYRDGGMARGAASIDYGGETVGDGSYPPMGSGAFAAQGYQQAAYHRLIYYYDTAGGVQTPTLAKSQEWPLLYTVDLQPSAAWGEAFFFGGPGG